MNPLIKQITALAQDIKLLYVEDDDEARSTTLEMLTNIFCKENIAVAVDGQDGLNTFKNHHFDLIITDINMPNLNGLEMLGAIHKLDKDVSMLILSAYNDSEYFLQAIKLNVDAFIIKPLTYKQFLETLHKVLIKISMGKRNEEYHTFLEQEIKERTQEIEKKLLYDDLTGLLSRYSFFQDIKNIQTPILFMVDINKFRIINEIYGSDMGSIVLKEFSRFLFTFWQKKDFKVYRLASDEFILLDTSDCIDHEKYEDCLEGFFQALQDFQVQAADEVINIEVTIGISTSQTFPFESAIVALEHAKIHNKKYAMYSSAIDNRVAHKDALKWKKRIKNALHNNGVIPVYQGIVDKECKIVKYEVLMRLRDEKTNELITPWNFLDIAIKTGLYPELSSSMIFQALHKIDEMQMQMSINFSYIDIENRLFSDEIEAYIKKNPSVGKLAIFEIVESQNIESYGKIKAFIQRFKKYGVRFAIDDFGSGFSNFEYILEMEPEYLKIDGSLIKNIDKDEKALILVKAIIQFSHELGIKIIAEYVHSKAIFEILKNLNVDEYQGFYFHEPLPQITL